MGHRLGLRIYIVLYSIVTVLPQVGAHNRLLRLCSSEAHTQRVLVHSDHLPESREDGHGRRAKVPQAAVSLSCEKPQLGRGHQGSVCSFPKDGGILGMAGTDATTICLLPGSQAILATLRWHARATPGDARHVPYPKALIFTKCICMTVDDVRGHV